MSIDIIVEKSKKLEGLLKRLGCQGKGLHELVSQAEASLDNNVVRACRKVATIRNKAVHEEGYRLYGEALQDFNDTADYAAEQLSALLAPKPAPVGKRPEGQTAAPPGARPAADRSAAKSSAGSPAGDQAAQQPKTVRDYLILGGLAIGAAGLWFWNEIRD
jgi:hypothetical protein